MNYHSKPIIYFLLFAVLLLLQNCESDMLVFNPGEEITEVRDIDISHIRHLYISSSVNVILQKQDEEKITVKAGENIIDKVETVVSDTILYLDDGNFNNWRRGYQDKIDIYVSHPGISKISFNGSAVLESKDTLVYKKDESLVIQTGDATGTINLVISASALQINHWFGVADINISGRAQSCYVGNVARGRLNLAHLEVENMHINNKSINDAFLNISKYLKGTISSSGNIYYQGSPIIDMKITGEGNLISVD